MFEENWVLSEIHCVLTVPSEERITKLEVLRQLKPPPNASIIELWQFFLDPDLDPERTPGSG